MFYQFMTPKPKLYKPVGRRKYFSNHFLIYKSPFSPESISLGSHIFVQSNVPSITHSLSLHIYWELDRPIFLITQNRPLSFNYILFFLNILFIWRCQVLVTAHGICYSRQDLLRHAVSLAAVGELLVCGMWDLVLWSGIKPRPLCWKLRVLATRPPGKSFWLHFFTSSLC